MRVLVASADPAFAKAARLALRSEALVVEVVADTRHLLEVAPVVPYNALVLDLALPGAHGVALLKRLRRQHVVAPILALAADPSPEARIDALRQGADDCLAKPVLTTELAARVHALARRAARHAGECLELDDLVLHCPKRRAFRAGRALPLTEREFLALEILVRAHGTPVSTARLVELLWHEKETPQTNFIAVLIMRLRRKVDEGCARKLVRTQRGAGYFVATPQD